MRRLYCGVLLCTAGAVPALAEPRSFAVNDPSGQYLVEVLFADAPAVENQLAPVHITLRDRRTLQVIQQLYSEAGNAPRAGAQADNGWLLGPSGLLYFNDFNFDGHLDLAIRNGNLANERYAYDVYLQTAQPPRWTLSQPLTDLARQPDGQMFDTSQKDRTLIQQTDRGCCWTRTTRWRLQGDVPIRLSSFTQEQIPASLDDSTSMPSGYMLRSRGEWQAGQWVETPRVEGPVIEHPQSFSGTLAGKLPVELWYQEQGAVLIGEVRYTRSGNGKPITLVGNRSQYNDTPYVYLHEFTDDGRRTGIWRITLGQAYPLRFTGEWVKPDRTDNTELTIDLAPSDAELPLEKLNDLPAAQRSGRYQMLDDFLGRDGVLDLTILPERDQQGREVAEFTISLTNSKTGEPIITEQHRVPMLTENLIIVQDPLYPKLTGPYHIQLVKGFAVLNYNAEADSPLMMSGYYRKQP
jgi:hypothetical protein